MMVREHLEAIMAKEEQARQKIVQARQEAASILERSKQEGEKLLEETRIKGVEVRKAMIAEAQDKAGKKIQEMRVENKKELSTLSDKARQNKGSALDLIMTRFREAT
jgi:vacuolar-type H+-ATPase subunit H